MDAMELYALVDLAETGPEGDIVAYVDASYIFHEITGQSSHDTIRKQVRRTNRGLWARFRAALRVRKECGHRFLLLKCASHGKDLGQDPAITLLNKRADTQAREGVKCTPQYIPMPVERDMAYGLMCWGRRPCLVLRAWGYTEG